MIFLKRCDLTSCVCWKLFFQANCYWFWAESFVDALSESVSAPCTDVCIYYIISGTMSTGDLNTVTHLKCIPPQKSQAPSVPVYYFFKFAIIENNNSFPLYSYVNSLTYNNNYSSNAFWPQVKNQQETSLCLSFFTVKRWMFQFINLVIIYVC